MVYKLIRLNKKEIVLFRLNHIVTCRKCSNCCKARMDIYSKKSDLEVYSIQCKECNQTDSIIVFNDIEKIKVLAETFDIKIKKEGCYWDGKI